MPPSSPPAAGSGTVVWSAPDAKGGSSMDTDQAELAGAEGWSLLATADETGSATDVLAAVERFEVALAADPDHVDAPTWRLGLGLALAARAEAGEHGAWDDAVALLRRAYLGPSHPDLDDGDVAAELAWLLVRRFQATAGPPDLISGLVADLDAITDPAGRPVEEPAVVMFRGLALLRRHQLLDDPGAAETGLDLLADALPRLPDDTPMLIEALVEYADGSCDAGRVEAGLSAVARARELLAPGEYPPELDLSEAALRDRRLQTRADPADRDIALACLERVVAVDAAGAYARQRYGELLFHRGDDTNRVDDLTRALPLLADAIAVAPEPPDRATAALYLGSAHLRRWQLAGDLADRGRAIEHLQKALDVGLPDPGLVAFAHRHLVGGHVHILRDSPAPRVVRAAQAAFAAALDALWSAPADADRAELALAAVELELALYDHRPDLFDPDRLDRLVAAAASHPDPPPQRDAQLVVARSLVATYRAVTTGATSGFGADGLLAALAQGVGRDPSMAGPIGLTSLLESLRTGDQARTEAAAALLDESGSAPAGLIAGFARLSAAHGSGAPVTELLGLVDELIAIAGARPDDLWIADYMLPYLTMMRNVLAPTGAADPPIRPRGFVAEVLSAATSVLNAAVAAISATDRAGRHHALLELERLADAVGDGPVHALAAQLLAGQWLLPAREGDRAAGASAVRWSEVALAALDGPVDPRWAPTALDGAEAYRLRGGPGDRARSRETGLAALRGHAWLVLLQAGTRHGLATATSAATNALRVARWCAADRAGDDLVRALDAGRGLVLHAATTSRGVAGQLTALGHHRLAREWTEVGGTDRVDLSGVTSVPIDLRGDLRHRVLTALADGSSSLLDPPGPARIRAALAAHGSDALIYLVPGSATEPGLAVAVPAREPVEVFELAALHAGVGSPLPDYAQAYEGWHDLPAESTREARGVALDTWRDALGTLCLWAWTAGADTVLAAAATRWTADGATPRLVLVPVGPLALVPWHAAGPGDGAAPVAARAVVSYAPSARLLCQTIARHRTFGDDTLIVGDPTGDLVAAGVEARVLHGTFYPEGEFLGSVGARAATVANLVSWLAGDARRSMLHLACHARAEPAAPGRSHLRLADRDLTVDELLELRPIDPLPVDTVVLAACSTNVSGVQYDEVFSLATAFLAAGARTAFGSLWTVPDGSTSRLMFLVHHHLRAGATPAEALHRAQRWALDPHRIAPDTMPAALAPRRGELPPSDPIVWAGFLHLGA